MVLAAVLQAENAKRRISKAEAVYYGNASQHCIPTQEHAFSLAQFKHYAALVKLDVPRTMLAWLCRAGTFCCYCAQSE